MAKKGDANDNLFCSFCGKNQKEVQKLIAGPAVYICDECIQLCSEIIEEEKGKDEKDIDRLLLPKEIKDMLDEYVIEQDAAKKILAVAVYNHYKRLDSSIRTGDVEIQKSNIILIGPTGCGKTLLAQTLARFLNVPFTIADATSLTEAGYVGEDVENILVRLYQASGFNQSRTERGIIYIDELDKIARTEGNPSITRDVSGEGVQQGLLKILEGTVSNIPPKGGRKHPEQSFVPIDTTNILFICGGAFEGLDKIVARRVGKKQVGFDADVFDISESSPEILEFVEPEDLLKYGLIPEMAGRLPVTAPLRPLDKNALFSILTEPNNAITKQYYRLFEMEGIKLTFRKEALWEAVAIAEKKKTGARALRSVFEKAMLDIMYNSPSKKDIEEIIITPEVISGSGKPEIIKKANRQTA